MLKSIRVPHTMVLLFAMAAVAYVLTWIIPAGSYEMVTQETGREAVVPGSFHFLNDARNLALWELFTAIPRALTEHGTAGIAIFILIVGGSIAVLRATGAIDALLAKVLNRVGERTGLLVFIGMMTFGIASATLGMAEEYIPVVAILITLCISLRLDTVTAIGIMVAGYGVGYGAAILNPFTVLVAQNIAEVPPTSGWWFRLILFVPAFAIAFHHVLSYARRVQADPTASLVHDVPEAQPPAVTEFPPMNGRRLAVVLATLVALVMLVVGVAQWGWYLEELGAMFIALAIFAGYIGGLDGDTIARRFTEGAAELVSTALIIGIARSIALILEDGQVLHTIVHAFSIPLEHVPASIAAIGMFLLQSVLNFFIPSGSGQAYVTMPLMAPLSDLLGLSRQIAVLAYQMGDGFMNAIVPTNAVLMGILGIAGIPYDRWFRFMAPLVLKLFAVGSVMIAIAVLVGYQ